jgi:hypothetical protein
MLGQKYAKLLLWSPTILSPRWKVVTYNNLSSIVIYDFIPLNTLVYLYFFYYLSLIDSLHIDYFLKK